MASVKQERERRAAGLCPECGKCPPELGFKRCARCRERSRACEAARVASGLCPCGKSPPELGYRWCAQCREGERARKAARVASGLCPRCGSRPEPGFKTCARCRASWRARWAALHAARIAAGVCTECNKRSPSSGYNTCDKCRIHHGVRYLGITGDDYRAMLKKQHGCCAICGEPPPAGKRLDVDHHHATHIVRELLCCDCNHGIGYFKESSEALMKSIEYLRHPPAQFLRLTFAQGKRRKGELLARQHGRCAVCSTKDPVYAQGWHVDHNHATGFVRGILCHGCNIGIGLFRESPKLLRAAARYLNKHARRIARAA